MHKNIISSIRVKNLAIVEVVSYNTQVSQYIIVVVCAIFFVIFYGWKFSISILMAILTVLSDDI
ncbi:hypothetical protein [Candidatus Ichthyocystis sparus]|uniref:hypothetical protein n=1 Tax=Candidatus Ichthyocystis sparus TaxID=1561004 RepID=UPI000B82BBD0|nr:hypothetical protein [Candidatus Ichthyocystis sparus]